MSFTSHEIAALGPTGKFTNGKLGFVVKYRLFCSAGDDGPSAALAYVESNIARWKDTYRLEAVSASSSSSSPGAGVDFDNRAWLKDVDVDREKGSADPWVWIATLSYEAPDGTESGEKPDGGKTDDPTEIAAEVDIQTVQYQKFAEKAVYISGYHSLSDNKLRGGALRPICNSAFCVFDPPPEVDDHRWVIRIKKNLASLDCDTVKCNVVNSKAVVISYRGVSKTIAALCGKTRDITATPVKHPVIGWYVQVQMYIDVSDRTWRLAVIDRGFSARAMVGDQDGHGGIIQDDSRGFVDEVAPQRRLVDAEGNPCSEPQLLDGDGRPLLEYKLTAGGLVPVYGIWKYYAEEDFGAWLILGDIVFNTSSSPGP